MICPEIYNGGVSSSKNINLIKEILNSDFVLVMDAIRRLEDGTCCLLDEDKAAATDLFQRLRLAVNDHVTFEESNLPAIVEYLGYKDTQAIEFSKQMRDEHRHILGLLDAAEHELFQTHPAPFRAVIKSVKFALHDHLQIEHDVPYEICGSTLEEGAFKRMVKRAEDGFLGLE